jgi:hypothetical protein
MKQFLFLLGILFSGTFSRVMGQEFIRFYQDTAESQVATDMEAAESGFWLGGNRLKIGSDNFSIWVYRVTESGEVIRRFSISSNRPQTLVGMKSLGPEKVALIYSEQNAGGVNESFLAMIDSNQISSSTLLPALTGAVLDDVGITRNGDLLVCGFKGYSGAQGNDFFLTRIRPEPLLIKWVFEDGLTSNDHIKSAMEAANGDILFNGDVFQSTYNPVAGRLDSNGTSIWITAIPTVWNDGSQKLTEGPDGRIWMVGESSTSAGPAFDTELNVLSADGTILWQQWLGSSGQDAAFHIENHQQAGFWVAGYSNASSSGAQPVSPFLMRLDANGQSLGEKFWPQTSPTLVYDFINRADTQFVFAGISLSRAFLLVSTEPELTSTFVVGVKSQHESPPITLNENSWWISANESWEKAEWISSDGRVLWQGKPEFSNRIPTQVKSGLHWIRLTRESEHRLIPVIPAGRN